MRDAGQTRSEHREVVDTRRNDEGFTELSEGLLRGGTGIRFRAHGRSMSPMIRDGDVLTVEPATLAGLRVGDVALHRIADGRLAVHRVVGRRLECGRLVLATRGDAALAAPDLVGEQDVLGRVTERERDGRVVPVGRGLRRSLGRPLVALLRFRGLAVRCAKAGRRLCARLLRRA